MTTNNFQKLDTYVENEHATEYELITSFVLNKLLGYPYFILI